MVSSVVLDRRDHITDPSADRTGSPLTNVFLRVGCTSMEPAAVELSPTVLPVGIRLTPPHEYDAPNEQGIERHEHGDRD